MIQRIYGLLLQEWYITKRSLEVIMDTIWFSTLSVIVFGFVAQYINIHGQKEISDSLIIGMILWEVIRINQYSLSLNPLWNIWSRNFSNLFITPIAMSEYILAQCISAFIKSLILFMINTSIITVFFGISLEQIPLGLLIYIFFIFSVFSWSIGLMLIGIIFRYGTRIQALAWGFVFLFQPLLAVFFPVSVMPRFMQYIALTLPPTYLFEVVRFQINSDPYSASYLVIPLVQTICFTGLSIIVFNKLLHISQSSGQFAKNDEG